MPRKPLIAYPSRILRYAQGVAGLRADDVLLCSFPKSGNTWVRFMLFQLLRAKRGRAAEVTFDQLDTEMPEFGASNLLSQWRFHDHSRRIVKTHMRHITVFSRCDSILILRQPRQVMVSYYHYAQSTRELAFKGDFAKFARHPRMGLPSFFRHYASWKHRATLVVNYEAIKASPVENLGRIASHCGISASHDELQLAVDASNMSAVRKAQEKSNDSFGQRFQNGFMFARGGKPDEWHALADDATNRYLEKLAKETQFQLDA